MMFVLLIPATALADERLRLMVMGDSLSAAYNMNQEQGWVALLAERLGDDVDVINASVSGETSGGGAQRLPDLLKQHEPNMVLLELGGNDGLRGPYREAFKNVFTRLAENYDVAFLPFLLEGVALEDELMQDDDIHPTAEAQPIIVENVWPLLAPRVERQLAQQASD